MPADLERELRRRADALGLRGDRRRAYIYGTLARVDRERTNPAAVRQIRRARRDRMGRLRRRARPRSLIARIRRIL